MGTSRGAAYRRFYLYSVLSVAVIASAVAGAILIHLGLQTVGFGGRPSPGDPSRNISLAAALLAIALPVGGAHLWLIVRSFADPAERATGIRHQYLSVWVAVALLVVLFMGQAAANAAMVQDAGDVTVQVSVIVVAAVVGIAAAWWIAWTPPTSTRPRIRAAIVVMLVAMAVAAIAAGSAASTAGALLGPAPGGRFSVGGSQPLSFEVFEQRQLRASLLTTGIALTVWALAFAWQRRWIDSRDRLGYGLLGYGLGTAVALVGVAFGLAAGIRVAQDGGETGAFTATWPSIAAGALLVAIHLTLLLLDRGRNGHPAVTTTRLVLAFPALVGLGMLVGGLAVGWHAVLERDEVGARQLTDELLRAGALLGVGLAAWVSAWPSFDRRSDAASAVRRFYLFTVVCLGLVAGLVSAVVVLYESITLAARSGDVFAGRTALTWVAPLLALAVIFVTHGRLLLRDQRATRAADVPVAADPLLALLEEVRAGRVSAEQAAAAIRAGVA